MMRLRRSTAAVAMFGVLGALCAAGVADAATSGAIGNRAFVDTNANGRQDTGEPGLAGVRVTLTVPATGQTIMTGLTDSGGWWGFRNLSTTSCYRVTYTIPTGYGASPIVTGGSTISPTGMVATPICPTVADQTHWDAGFVRTSNPVTGAIGNRAFVDTNANGRQDTGEPGLAGVRITLSISPTWAMFSGLTDSGGWWGLKGLSTQSCYQLAYTIPSGYRASPTTAGGSTIGPDGKVAQPVCPTAATQDQWDAGFVRESGPATTTTAPPTTTTTVPSTTTTTTPQPTGNGTIGVELTERNGGVSTARPGVIVRLADGTETVARNGRSGATGGVLFLNLPTDRCYDVDIQVPEGTRNLVGNGTRPVQMRACLDAANPKRTLQWSFTTDPAPEPAIPDGVSFYRNEYSSNYVTADIVSAVVTTVDGRPRLDVTVGRDPVAGSSHFLLSPPPGISSIVPGTYNATPSLLDSDGAWVSPAIAAPGCTAGPREMYAIVSQIAVAANGTVTRLALTFDDLCEQLTGRLLIAPGAAQTAPDRDADGIVDTGDNCLTVANGNQRDIDSDNIGDACDPTIATTSVSISSPLGERTFGGRSTDLLPSHSNFSLSIDRADGAQLTDASGKALVDFAVSVRADNAFYTPESTLIRLRFKAGDQVTSLFRDTGPDSALHAVASLVMNGASDTRCTAPTFLSLVHVTRMTFNQERTAVVGVDATIGQQCRPNSIAAAVTLRYNQPIGF